MQTREQRPHFKTSYKMLDVSQQNFSELDHWLGKFYLGARQIPQSENDNDEGELYSVNTLRGFMYGIN